MLCVTDPHFCGLGGDAFMIVSDRQGAAFTLSGIGQAAARVPQDGRPIPTRGPGSAITAAAAVDTWEQAFTYSQRAWGGRQSWKGLFQRALAHATDGFPMTPSQRFCTNFRANEIGQWPDVVRAFTADGRVPDIGETVRRPELARSLTMLAENGGRDFYEGELARRIARGLEQAQTLAAVLTRQIDYRMVPLTALARPRFLLGKTFSDSRDSLKLELDAGEAVFADLAARGHAISPIPAQSPLAGHPGAIRIADDGGFVGAHDPRSDGLALAL